MKSADYLFWAVSQRTGNQLRNHILIQLCNRAGKKGECFPSHSTIAKDCECSVRSVINQISELEKMGLVRVTRRATEGMKTSSIYSFPLANTDVQQVHNDVQQMQGVVQEVHRGSAGGAQGVVQEVHIETPIIKHPIKHPLKHTPSPRTDFDDFYDAYPKKVGRSEAQKAWKKLNPQPALITRIMNDVVQRVEQGAWCTGKGKQYIPGPAPYLNQAKWTDEIIPRPEFVSSKPTFSFDDVVDLSESL